MLVTNFNGIHTWMLQAYFVKGETLYRMNFVEESLIVFLLCLVLEPGKTTTLNKIYKVSRNRQP